MSCDTFLFFKFFLPLLFLPPYSSGYCYLIFFYLEAMELFNSVLYWCLINIYIFLVLSMNFMILSVFLIILIPCCSFFKKVMMSFRNVTSQLTFPGLILGWSCWFYSLPFRFVFPSFSTVKIDSFPSFSFDDCFDCFC